MHHASMDDTTSVDVLVQNDRVDSLSLVGAILEHPECPRQIPPLAESSKGLIRLPEKNRRNPRFLAFVAQKDPVFLARLLCMTTLGECAEAGCHATDAEEAIAILGVAKSLSVMMESASFTLPAFASTEIGSRFLVAQRMILSRCVTHSMTAKRLTAYLDLGDVQAARLQICCLLDSLGLLVGLYGNKDLSMRLQEELLDIAASGAITDPLADSHVLHDYWRLAHYLTRLWGAEWAVQEILRAEKSPIHVLVSVVEKLIAAKRKGESQMAVLHAVLKRHASLTSRMGIEEIDLAVLPW
jgi:hypothetical protein